MCDTNCDIFQISWHINFAGGNFANKPIEQHPSLFPSSLWDKSNGGTSKLVGRKERLRQQDEFCIHDTIVPHHKFESRYSEAVTTHQRTSAIGFYSSRHWRISLFRTIGGNWLLPPTFPVCFYTTIPELTYFLSLLNMDPDAIDTKKYLH